MTPRQSRVYLYAGSGAIVGLLGDPIVPYPLIRTSLRAGNMSCYVMLMVGLVRRDLRSGSMVGLVYTPVVFVSV